MAVAGALGIYPAFGSGSAAPLAMAAGIMAVVMIAGSLVTGSAVPLGAAVVLLLVEFEVSVILGATPVATAPVVAAGLYALVELTLWPLEVRGRQPGWSSITGRDVARLVIVAAGFAVIVGSIQGVSTALPFTHGIIVQAIGLTAAAVAIATIWVLLGQRDTQDDRTGRGPGEIWR